MSVAAWYIIRNLKMEDCHEWRNFSFTEQLFERGEMPEIRLALQAPPGRHAGISGGDRTGFRLRTYDRGES